MRGQPLTPAAPLPTIGAIMKIALAQLNPTVGDIDGNARRILDAYARAARAGADLVVTPELSLLGYPPRDLLLKPRFVADNLAALERLAGHVGGTALLVGYVDRTDRERGLPLRNAAALMADGGVVARKVKRLLPTYDVFDEMRYFEPGDEPAVVPWGGATLGLLICEDLWTQESAGPAARLYHGNPVADLVEAGADVLINMSASPFVSGKFAQRAELVRAQALRHGRPVVYVNQVGGNDSLVFDGASFAVSAAGEVVAQLKAFEEDLALVDLAPGAPPAERADLPASVEALRGALVLGLRDYLRKTGFREAVLGLSGGIDSSLVACLAAEAVGAENVLGVAMPSRYSSAHSVEDARTLASALGIRFLTIPIDGPHTAFEEALAEAFAGRGPDVTEENLQARVRGTILMGLSNKFGSLVLASGNKSEISVGYCTLYGDMVGGLAVIGDVPKTLVYRLCRHINATDPRSPIPERVLTKAPSAELRPEQKDADSLPPYDVLDPILDAYVRDERSYDQIVAAGFDPATVSRVIGLVDRNEYKRQQAAPVLKVTSRAFGFGRRMPIAQRYEPTGGQ
jgi:NAD+ synthase (glutamine-hydrolysing)